MAVSRVFILIAMAAFPAVQAEAAAANPIRKVVTMLQSMQKKVEAEGVKEKELYDKFMCWCKSGAGSLSASIAAADNKVPAVGSDIKEAEEQLEQTKAALQQAQTDRSAAKEAMASATAIRNKEAAEFAKEKAEADTNIAAITSAVAALEKGMAGSFLQTNTAQLLKKLALSNENMVDGDRQELLSFLSGSSEYAPASGEITGILKTMGDEMAKGLAEATAAENASITNFDELMAAKKKEVGALTASIETKMQKVGELGVSIVQMKNDLSDTQEALEEDKKFLANMEKDCASKSGEYEANTKTRGEELVALADTIKILNDDDALEMFKKTLPGAGSSFVQVQKSTTMRARALALIEGAKSPKFDFIALALHGKKIGFEKVIKMVDDMVALLKAEQLDDEHKKEYCAAQFDTADDKKKGLDRSISDSEATIESAKEGIATLIEEIAALEAGIKALDKSVAEATEQRQAENADYKELMASNGAAKEILGFAKNRLNKFYNPKLYKPPAKKELSRQDRIVENMSFVQIRSHSAGDEAPPAAPETAGAIKTKGAEATGVIAMIDLLVKDLDKEMTESEVGEKDGQADYEQAMKDSAEKRVTDTKSLTDKGADKANLEGDLQAHSESKASATKELMATLGYIQSLHAECDWLLQYFDVRKEARTSEIDALGKAKAVLSGADFSFVQTKRYLRHA